MSTLLILDDKLWFNGSFIVLPRNWLITSNVFCDNWCYIIFLLEFLYQACDTFGVLKHTRHFVTDTNGRTVLNLALVRSQFEHCSTVISMDNM